ncbi:MAG: response regulator transcription factor [Actinomycetota bacterium]|nr:response regulator transcription factor [Actinomycetota bacterium]
MAIGGKILVVDDEQSVHELVRPYLEAEGYQVFEARSGTAALVAFEEHAPDLAVVDVMLPGVDGFELVRQFRSRSHAPIILLTARREVGSRVAGLKLGADDYVMKPFSVPELIARVQAQLRRVKGFDDAESSLKLGAVEIDGDARRCLVRGEEVELTRREFDLLWALASEPGRVLTRADLLRAAWGTTYVSERTVDVHLAGLRKKLGGELNVTALRGVGYRLDA